MKITEHLHDVTYSLKSKITNKTTPFKQITNQTPITNQKHIKVYYNYSIQSDTKRHSKTNPHPYQKTKSPTKKQPTEPHTSTTPYAPTETKKDNQQATK